jgi:hypothetical protein
MEGVVGAAGQGPGLEQLGIILQCFATVGLKASRVTRLGEFSTIG